MVARTKRFVLAGLVACSVVALSGCTPPAPANTSGLSGSPSATNAPTPQASKSEPNRDVRYANALAQALQDALSSQSFSFESRRPRGGDLDRFYAEVSGVSTSSASVTFDAGQLYLGRAAYEAAKQDGQPDLPNPQWTRNRYRVKQHLVVGRDVVVVLQTAGGSQDGDASFGARDVAGLTPVSFSEFAERFNANPDQYGKATGYVITTDGGAIRSIVQVYFP